MISKKAKKRSLQTASGAVEKFAAKTESGKLHNKNKLSNEVPTQNGTVKKLKKHKKQQKTQEGGGTKPVDAVNKAVANVVVPSETKNKKNAEPEKKVLHTQLDTLAERQKTRIKRKLQRVKKAEAGKVVAEKSPEMLKKRIEEIRARDTLTKTAKRKLGALLKKLRALNEGESEPKSIVPDSDISTEKSDAAKVVKPVKVTKLDKSNVNRAATDGKNKKGDSTGKLHVKTKVEAKKPVAVEQVSEEDDEDESENDIEDELEAEQSETDGDDDDNDGTENDDVDMEPLVLSPKEEKKVLPTKKGKLGAEKQKNQQTNKEENKPKPKGKKKRYVLFVGHLPENITEDALKKHFLTKCNEVVSVRIPKQADSNKTRSFAYVEFKSSEDFQKGFSLHHSFLNGRRIDVQYSNTKGNSKLPRKNVIAKNKKLQALSKTVKFEDTEKNKKKKFFGKKNEPNAKV